MILDLAGYSVGRPLHELRLLEPSFGTGDFLLPALDRLLAAYAQSGGTPEAATGELGQAVCAVELHAASYALTRKEVVGKLVAWGVSRSESASLADQWLVCDDFLLAALSGFFDVVVGNPPYVRQERIPRELLAEYRRRYQTVYDRADLYVPFYERCLDLLQVEGKLGFICANRWLKNRYGGPLREKVARGFDLAFFVDMVDTDAFHSEVIAYPAITVIRRSGLAAPGAVTRVARRPRVETRSLRKLVDAMLNGGPSSDTRIREVTGVASGRDPWLLDDPDELRLLRRLEAQFPILEDTGCKVGIGVATGADRVFIGAFDALAVEDERKLPLVMAPDLQGGEIAWGGKGVVNPFEEDGRLAALDRFPLFAAFVEEHREAIAGRHVARKNPARWYRTIDRIYPSLTTAPKLLIPDIKGTATVVYDQGRFYPHHNLYFVMSSAWDLRALQAVLRSSVAVLFVSAYCVRMAGGFLRFQAQYLRRIRLPQWSTLPEALKLRLARLGGEPDLALVDRAVAELYGLSEAEAALVARVSEAGQVRPKGAALVLTSRAAGSATGAYSSSSAATSIRTVFTEFAAKVLAALQ